MPERRADACRRHARLCRNGENLLPAQRHGHGDSLRDLRSVRICNLLTATIRALTSTRKQAADRRGPTLLVINLRQLGFKCDRFSAGCQSGGSYGTAAMYNIGGRNLCMSCAVKMMGSGGLPGVS